MPKFVVNYPNDGNGVIIYGPFDSELKAQEWMDWMQSMDLLHDSSGEGEPTLIPMTKPPTSIKFKGKL